MGRRDEERVEGARNTSRSRSRERQRADHRVRDSESSRPRRRSRSTERSASRSNRHKNSSRSRSGSPAASRSAKERRSAQRSVSADRKPKERRRRSRSRSSSRDRSRHRHRRRDRSSSVSESDSESSSDSSSGSDSEDDRRRSKSKRSHRKKDSKKHKKHKKDGRKKDKKDKKEKKEKRKKKSASSHAVNQNAYGKYGILRESDFHTKSQSFQAWLRDIKGVTEFNGPKWEALEMFKEYMEDYNTATMPHDKYYDIEKYEMRQYAKEQQKRAKHQLNALGAAVPDEAAFQRERQAQRLAREQEEFKLVLQTMDTDKIDAMRRQEQLRAQMQMQYKAGNVAEARRLEQLLKADEEDRRGK